jgi:hypothetical protein
LSPETVALWHFDEKEDYMRPSDVLAHVGLLVPAVTNRPTIVTGAFGLARGFAVASSRGYRGVCPDVPSQRALRLTRSFCIDVVLQPLADPAAPETIWARGKTGSSAERQVACVQLLRSTGAFRFRWEEKDGTLRTADVTGIQYPAGRLYLAFNRVWRAPDDCDVEVYINGELAGVANSATANIDDGDSGEVTVGCRFDGANYVEFLNAEVDELRVAQGARSAEEIKHTFNVLFTYPQWGYELIQNSKPPGSADPSNPESLVLRTQMLEGDAMALAWSKVDELSLFYHPDVAWSVLDHWERITRLAPLPTDSVQARRDRVVSHLRKIQGYHRDGIREAVYKLLGYAVPADVPITELSNMFVDDLGALGGAWVQEPRDGTITPTGTDTTLALQAGDDGRWLYNADEKAVRIRTDIRSSVGMEMIAAFDPSGLAADSMVGLFLLNLTANQNHLFGIFNDAGTLKFAYRRFTAGAVLPTPVHTLGVAVPAAVDRTYLRIRVKDSGLLNLAYRTDGSGYDGPWTEVFDDIATIDPINYGGAFLSADTNPSAGTQSVDVRDWRLWCPASRHVYNWFVYVDPVLHPEADLAGAQVVLDRMKPAHTNGSIITSLIALCDDPFTGCDRTPLGA